MNLSSMVFLLSFSLFFLFISLMLVLYNKSYMLEFDLLSLNSVDLVYVLYIDWISSMFLSFVMFISSMVLFYSGGYMEGDPNLNRFIYLVLGFVMSMGFMIISPNLVSILLGWDGLGLVSYALVIYYQNEKSSNAGMLTVLSNRVGDVAILLSISLMLMLGSWNFTIYSFFLDDSKWLMIKFLLVLAAMTKSAQIPFSAWLPAAMAAPTPVSALVHSSTLVTAGVYLMIRFSEALVDSVTQTFLLLIACLTMFMSGLGANFEYDLKKIIALSTLSQLGVMMSILALGFADLAFFHLLTHALFKALLFMCAGIIIHNVNEYQDIRCMGGLINFMPLTCMCMNLANFSLCGMPFLSGFYSKDLILEVAFMSPLNMVSFFLYVISTGLTVCYTFRLIFYSLTGNYNLNSMSCISDENKIMTNPLIMLSMMAIISGWSLSWLIFPELYMVCLSNFIKMLALTVSILGALIGYFLNMMEVSFNLNSLSYYPTSVFVGSMWFMPYLSTMKISDKLLFFGSNLNMIGDKGWSETLGGQGFYLTLMEVSSFGQLFQENSVKIFMKVFMFSLIVLGLLLI
uniref:NADH dehydrogenase subunit 5 n=1 Tax=Emerita talpoida TaxID=101207 RepID=UPI0021FE2F2D|nr:NADH dehydrogenase subunit 5 [Emerita talpoida]UXL87267.1 NADH dehydrogenase subunit 5 [Emerita talpoida]